MVHVRDQQAEENMQLLDLGSKRRGIQCRSVKKFIDGIIDFRISMILIQLRLAGEIWINSPPTFLQARIELMSL